MQSFENLAPLREIIASVCSRYALITPKGIVLPTSTTLYNPLPATIIIYKPARTRYVNKKPLCRSLNACTSLNDKTSCVSCSYRRTCTPQIALEILYRSVPFRIMLAYTSAKNFVSFLRTLHTTIDHTENALVEISVIDRGKWGEAKFSLTQAAKGKT
jgi:hypothetical protein